MSEEMSENLEMEAITLLGKLNTSIEATISGLGSINEVLDESEKVAKDQLSVLDAFLDKNQQASEEVHNTLNEELNSVLVLATSNIEETLSGISVLELKIETAIKGEQGVIQSLDSAMNFIESVGSNVEDNLIELDEASQIAFTGLDESLGTVINGIDSSFDTFEQDIMDVALSLDDDISSEIVEPLKDISENLQATWQRIFDERVEKILTELFDGVREEIQIPLNTAVDEMAMLLEAELRRLVEELVHGDTEGEGVRSELESSLNLIEDAFEPLKAAFDAFRGLASSVGVEI